MKKYFTLFAIITLCFFGMQSAQAQSNPNAELNAKLKAEELQKMVELTTKQTHRVFDVLYAFEKTNEAGENSLIDAGNIAKLKEILSEAQFKKYQKKTHVKREEKKKKDLLSEQMSQ